MSMGRMIPYTMENKSHVPNHHTERADDAKVPPPLNVATQKKPAFLWEFHGDLRWICLRGPKKKTIARYCQWIMVPHTTMDTGKHRKTLPMDYP